MNNQMAHFGAAKASFSIASAENLNYDAKNRCWKVRKDGVLGLYCSYCSRKGCITPRAMSYPDDLMENCGVNYDYGGVWARIPTPENLRIIRYYGEGG